MYRVERQRQVKEEKKRVRKEARKETESEAMSQAKKRAQQILDISASDIDDLLDSDNGGSDSEAEERVRLILS